jgi:hypothetical protein
MFVFHVDTIPYNNRIGKGTAPAGAGFSSPLGKTGAFKPVSCNNVPHAIKKEGPLVLLAALASLHAIIK